MASPNCLDAHVGMGGRTAATAASGATDELLRRLLDSPGSVVVDDDGAAVLGDRVRPVCRSFSGLSISRDGLRSARAVDDVLAGGEDSGPPAWIEPFAWISTCSPDCSGKSAASAIISAALGVAVAGWAASVEWFVPTLPATTVARTTKRIQPRIADLRCRALQRPARAAKVGDN